MNYGISSIRRHGYSIRRHGYYSFFFFADCFDTVPDEKKVWSHLLKSKSIRVPRTNGLAMSDLATSGLAMSGLATSGLATSGLATSGLATSGLATKLISV